jgi:hypothetical protein
MVAWLPDERLHQHPHLINLLDDTQRSQGSHHSYGCVVAQGPKLKVAQGNDKEVKDVPAAGRQAGKAASCCQHAGSCDWLHPLANGVAPAALSAHRVLACRLPASGLDPVLVLCEGFQLSAMKCTPTDIAYPSLR